MAVTQTGADDTTFGVAGEVHTNSVAPQRKAATALAPDGKILVAGGSNSNGKMTIERFTANGARDMTWGTSGKVTIDLGGKYARPTGIAPAGAGAVYVIAQATSSNREVFTLAKATTAGLDRTFGSSGIARATFAGKQAVANDLAVLPGGKILLAGSVRPTTTSPSSDTGLARFTSAGALDPTFGTGGMATHNLHANEDFAAAIATLADGRFLVTGPANGVGMVARFTAAGALDPGFGTAGKVVGGLMQAGFGFAPADIVVDGSGRPLVTGAQTFGSPTNYRWAVLRLTQNATPLLDNGFGDAGRAVFEQCGNTVGAGADRAHPRRREHPGARRLRRRPPGPALARLLGGNSGPPVGPIELRRRSRHRRRRPRAHPDRRPRPERGARRRRGRSGHGDAPDRDAPDGDAADEHGVDRDAPRRPCAARACSRRRCAGPRCASPCSPRSGCCDTTWQELLGVDVPLQTLTMEDALEINPDGGRRPDPRGDRPELDRDAADEPGRDRDRASARSPRCPSRPAAGARSSRISRSTARTASHSAETTLVDLEILGDDLSAYYDEPISLLEVDLGTGESAAPLADFLLSELDLTLEPFRDAEASQFAAILNCGAVHQPQARRPDRTPSWATPRSPSSSANCRSRACRT